MIKTIYKKIFSVYQKELKRELKDSNTLLDIGCGSDSPIKDFSHIHSTGVDSFQPSIDKSKEKNIHNQYYRINILDINKKFKENSFDCVVALDLIEHLTREQGLKLLDTAEKIAKKKVIIFTPNGFLKQGEYDNNPNQVHKSGYTVEEFKQRGYKVVGIGGLKSLRGEFAKIKYKPKIFWLLISNITQLFVKNKPEKAFQLLCIKSIP